MNIISSLWIKQKTEISLILWGNVFIERCMSIQHSIPSYQMCKFCQSLKFRTKSRNSCFFRCVIFSRESWTGAGNVIMCKWARFYSLIVIMAEISLSSSVDLPFSLNIFKRRKKQEAACDKWTYSLDLNGTITITRTHVSICAIGLISWCVCWWWWIN